MLSLCKTLSFLIPHQPHFLCFHLFSCWEQPFVRDQPKDRSQAQEARLCEGLACGRAGGLEP